jgi:predicted phage tail protein
MKVVKVYGPLRKYLGQCRFEFVADTPAQAMKALCVNFPGLAQWLLDREAEGMAFRVTRGRDKITNEAPEGLVLPWSEREVFSIAPVIVGAGGPVGRILAGVALVTLAIVLAPAGAGFLGLGAGLKAGAVGAATGFISAGVSTVIGSIGASLIFGGIAQLISPTPSMGSLTSGREAARLESFTFSGIVNTSKQGMAVPICYGRAFVGSAVISSGLDVNQVAV